MNDDKMRAEFEKWAERIVGCTRLGRWNTETYCWPNVQLAWEAWQETARQERPQQSRRKRVDMLTNDTAALLAVSVSAQRLLDAWDAKTPLAWQPENHRTLLEDLREVIRREREAKAELAMNWREEQKP